MCFEKCPVEWRFHVASEFEIKWKIENSVRQFRCQIIHRAGYFTSKYINIPSGNFKVDEPPFQRSLNNFIEEMIEVETWPS